MYNSNYHRELPSVHLQRIRKLKHKRPVPEIKINNYGFRKYIFCIHVVHDMCTHSYIKCSTSSTF